MKLILKRTVITASFLLSGLVAPAQANNMLDTEAISQADQTPTPPLPLPEELPLGSVQEISLDNDGGISNDPKKQSH